MKFHPKPVSQNRSYHKSMYASYIEHFRLGVFRRLATLHSCFDTMLQGFRSSCPPSTSNVTQMAQIIKPSHHFNYSSAQWNFCCSPFSSALDVPGFWGSEVQLKGGEEAGGRGRNGNLRKLGGKRDRTVLRGGRCCESRIRTWSGRRGPKSARRGVLELAVSSKECHCRVHVSKSGGGTLASDINIDFGKIDPVLLYRQL